MGIQITPRQEQFLINYTFKGMAAGPAYAAAYKRPLNNTAYVSGHRLLRNAKILAELEAYRVVALEEVAAVVATYREAMSDQSLPAVKRFEISKEFLNGKILDFLKDEIVIRETCSKCAKQDERLREEERMLAEMKDIRQRMGV